MKAVIERYNKTKEEQQQLLNQGSEIQVYMHDQFSIYFTQLSVMNLAHRIFL